MRKCYTFAEEHVQKQESFDCGDAGDADTDRDHRAQRASSTPRPAPSTRPDFSPTSATTDARSRNSARASACWICAATRAVSRIYAKTRGGADEVVGIDLDEEILAHRRAERAPQQGRASDSSRPTSSPGCAMSRSTTGDQYDVVMLDPAKMTRDREQVIPALKKYLDMNKLALGCGETGRDLANLFMHRPRQRGAVSRHAAPRGVLREPHGAGAEDSRRWTGSSVPGARARVAVSEGGVLPGRVARRSRFAFVVSAKAGTQSFAVVRHGAGSRRCAGMTAAWCDDVFT